MKKILCAQGGGYRGVIIATVLNEIEKEFGSVYNLFDYFGGASTGALITALINKGYTTEEVLKFYKEYGEFIFNESWFDEVFEMFQNSPKYDGKNKTLVIEKYFNDFKFKNFKKPFTMTLCSLNGHSVIVNSWEEKFKNDFVSKYLDAGTAAPIYFPSKKIGNNEYIDGGINHNNPVDTLSCLANKIIFNGYDHKILNIGTGFKDIKVSGAADYNVFEWLRNGNLIDYLSDTSPNNYRANILSNNNHTLINFEIPEKMVSIDNASNKIYKQLNEIGKSWYKNNYNTIKLFLFS